MSFTQYLAAALLNHIFTDPAYTPPATLYLGLSTTTPTEAGANFTEPVGNNYARVATTATDWGAATNADPSVKSNSAVLTFPSPSGSWGTLTHYGLFDASTAGNLMSWQALDTPRTIGSGETPSFPVGDLDLTLD